MKDYSSQSFTSNGRKYTLMIVIFSGDNVMNFQLDNQYIECFEYESTLNDLVVRGSIRYRDQYGNMDKLLEKPGAYCNVIFVRNEQQADGDIEVEKMSDTEKFRQTFLVENINIEERQGDTIMYRINVVSINMYKCIANIDYTNYATGDEQVFDIIKACLTKSKLAVDNDAFDKVQTAVKIPYITNGNDNAFTAVKYLLNKLYYFADKDDSLKFLFYNYYRDMYQIFDMKNQSSLYGTDKILLSLLRDAKEKFLEEQEIGIGTVTRFPVSQTFDAISDRDFYDYNYNSNRFVHRDIKSEQVTDNYFSKTFMPSNDITRKLIKISRENELKYLKRGSYWNNDYAIYDDMVRYLAKGNAIMVETSGQLLRFPATIVSIEVDRPNGELTSENPGMLKDLETRYRGLEGIWVSFRVHSYVYPSAGSYRQVLTLMRNFTNKNNPTAK